jgi:hypothetical protein
MTLANQKLIISTIDFQQQLKLLIAVMADKIKSISQSMAMLLKLKPPTVKK